MASTFEPFFVDRRSEPRRRVDNCLLKLDPGRGRAPITCFVWDISEGGTRLKMSEDIDLPPVVHVIIGNVRKAARGLAQGGPCRAAVSARSALSGRAITARS
jgi:hypothetical protein